MLFEYAAIGGVSSASGFAPRSTRSTHTRVVRALCGASLTDPTTSCSRQHQSLVPRSNRARRLVLSPRAGIASTQSGHLTSQLPRARLGCPVSSPERFRVGWFFVRVSLLQPVSFTTDATASGLLTPDTTGRSAASSYCFFKQHPAFSPEAHYLTSAHFGKSPG